jgi:hypothetical protein
MKRTLAIALFGALLATTNAAFANAIKDRTGCGKICQTKCQRHVQRDPRAWPSGVGACYTYHGDWNRRNAGSEAQKMFNLRWQKDGI